MKKIISFSLYNNISAYILGAYENLQLQQIYYPDWCCRFYIDSTVHPSHIRKLENDAEIIMMENSVSHDGMLWRFMPLDDDNVDIFIVRDTDARLNRREVSAVKEWEYAGTGEVFHIMRDHPNHYHYIMGGMWGARKQFKPNFKKLYSEWLEMYPKKGYGIDMMFLREKIWPLIKNDHIAHIADLDFLRKTGKERLFPVENSDGSFVGMSYGNKKR